MPDKIDADAELLKLSRIGKVQPVSEVGETHGSADARRRHCDEVHVEHRSERRDAVGLDVTVGRVADEAGRVPDSAKVDDLCADDAGGLVDGLTVHLLLRWKAVDGGRFFCAEDGDLFEGEKMSKILINSWQNRTNSSNWKTQNRPKNTV